MRLVRLSSIVAAGGALGALIFLANTNPVVRNLPRAVMYERTMDRYAQQDETQTDIVATRDEAGREASLVGALFGRDDDLPHMFGLVACKGSGGKDGMPILFSHEVDHTTLEPGDITITLSSGKTGEVTCLTMSPADDPGELRTALLIGQFGDLENPPTRIEITGNVLSLDRSLNFKGSSIVPAALELGPSLVWAEIVPQSQWDFGANATPLPWGGGDGCPAGTKQIVRAAWNGGVTNASGDHAAAIDPQLYKVTVETSDGDQVTVAPFALADMGDGDNNHKLCLDVADPAMSVWFPAGHVTDPRDDLNDETSVTVTPLPKTAVGN